MSLFPVIHPVPPPPASISGKEKVAWIQDASREALKICASLMGIKLKELKKNFKGAPVPFDGTYWSVSHKSLFAAAVLGKYPIGIDIEEIKPRSDAVFQKVISEEEESLCGQEGRLQYFFRIWTAKEAVLKAEGVGLAGLSKCRVTQVPNDTSILLNYEGKPYQVVQTFFKKHIASVVTNGESVEWILRW
ncbi:MAG TPA: 4'-phosphopantetheinyl transferase superfamily protein [Nitrospinota bacterium]|jgi:4'-phosphopantetheinyl transferase|nr:4'-phosphopantetheinyl transferase superfamily protein [Nitrospinota bacterium]